MADGAAPGAVTRDGCPVEVYRRLPAMGEPELVHAWAGPSASVLDLGAGVGRIADPLVELGHDVLAVDDSPDMLASVRRARVHLGRIEELRLAERFDVVLLASHLVNTPDPTTRAALLGAATRHLRPGGRLLAQWHPPEWFDALRAGDGHESAVGGLTVRFAVHDVAGDLLTAEVRYAVDATGWSQPFQARRLDSGALDAALTRAGLRRVHLSPADPGWFGAVRVDPGTA